ncbi:META domain-containing protein [Microbacteriaceae bacterium VKM Ac-2855]|nr:META domain-containing protein [Microbacteriaceae bacterium VKM Ac-2855]
MRRALGTLAVVGTLVLGLSGCAEGSGSASVAVPEAQQLVGRWVTGTEYEVPTVPFILLADDGTWTGSDGCNGVQGEWSIDDAGDLSVSAGPSTLIACNGVNLPVMFTDAVSARIDGGRLRLFDEQDFTTVKLSRSTVDEPNGAVGTWGGAPDAYLTLDADGTLNGNDGCNALGGRWTGDGSAVEFTRISSTLMGCPDVETWLGMATSATISGNEMIVTGASGAEIGTLARSE